MQNFQDFQQLQIQTDRLRVAYYHIGEGNRKKLLVIHGNISSSIFFMPLVPYLENRYDIIVPDLRCFGNTQALPIDATRGYRDWSDDIYAFCKAIGWKKFDLMGWSMGGDIAMQFVIDHASMVRKLVLTAPGSPYGFGGTKDEKGTPHNPIGLGSGGGTVNPAFTATCQLWNGNVMRSMLNKYLFKEPFRMSKEWEDRFVKASCAMRTGNDYYPGDFQIAWKWPYVRSGNRGVLNTMSPEHGNLNALLDVTPKPPILWIRGDDDQIVSDHSMMEMGNLGRIGMIPGWPGERIYPPQPMIQQTRYFLNQYKEKGGTFAEIVIPGGHVCILESPLHFISALDTFLK